MGAYRQEEGGKRRLERVPARLLEEVLRGGTRRGKRVAEERRLYYSRQCLRSDHELISSIVMAREPEHSNLGRPFDRSDISDSFSSRKGMRLRLVAAHDL